MHRWHSRRGFTLVELLVVIGVIGVLMAVLFPVFSKAKASARETKCRSNMWQLVTALKSYHEEHGRYPDYPYYDTDDNKYYGGFSDLYPDYITDQDLFICPDDSDALKNVQDCRDRIYCSYNGIADWDDDNDDDNIWDLKYVLYNYNGYTYQFKLDPDDPDRIDEISAGNGFSSGYDTGESGCILPKYAGLPAWMDGCLANGTSGSNDIPDWLDKAGLSWRHFPGLVNRHAPDTTIVTHCPYHRKYDDEDTERDLVVRLSGKTDKVYTGQMGDPEETGVPMEDDGDWAAATPVSAWVHQNF